MEQVPTERIFNFSQTKNYQKSADVFIAHSTEIEAKLKCWEEEMPRIVKQISSSAEDTIKVLAIGSGNGKPFDISLLDILSSVPNVKYTVVEPRPDAVEDFKMLADSKFHNVQFHWFIGTFQDYQEQEWPKHKEQFDLVHLVACIHYLGATYEELRAILVPCCKEMVKETGALVILRHQSDEVKVLMPHAENPECYAMPDLGEKLASEGGWKWEKFEIVWKLNVTLCFDENSEAGGLFLDILTKIPNFRGQNKETVERALEHLRGICGTMEDGSKIVNNVKSDLSVIWKRT